MSVASCRSSSLPVMSSFSPVMASPASSPAIIAADEDPSPRPWGILCLNSYFRWGSSFPTALKAAFTPTTTKLLSSRGISSAPSPSTVMVVSLARLRVNSFHMSRAIPTQSYPDPMFAEVAGTWTVTDLLGWPLPLARGVRVLLILWSLMWYKMESVSLRCFFLIPVATRSPPRATPATKARAQRWSGAASDMFGKEGYTWGTET
mmetsp:Transcript_4036/g.8978  ORF Transcript_4036/g.8978 Transcript_4036/m.8978 type:complete len:205 (-) Transcript_4036:1-615(-)